MRALPCGAAGVRLISSFLCVVCLFMICGCDTFSENEPFKSGSVNCRLQMSKTLLSQYAISTIELRIVSADNAVFWGPQTFSFSDHGATLENVKPGENFRVHARAMEENGTLASSGFSQPFTVNGGQNTNAGVIALKTFGTFTYTGESVGSSHTYRLAVGDLNGDNHLDIIVSIALASGFNEVWLNDGTGHFNFHAYMTGADGNNIETALADLNGDGYFDAYTAVYFGHGDRVWFNDGTGNFTDSGQRLGSGYNYSVSLGDLNGDGHIDAFVANRGVPVGQGGGGGPDQVWINDGRGYFNNVGSLGNDESLKVALGDLNGDGHLDAYVACDGPDNETGAPDKVWFNDGNGSFSPSGQNIGDRRAFEVALGDIDGDGDLDAVTANLFGDYNQLWLNDGKGLFSDSGRPMPNILGMGVALGDIDGDGYPDLFFSNAYETPNTVWRNDGLGYFFDTGMQLGNSYTVSSILRDVNGDGFCDVINANILTSPRNEVWFFQPGQ